MELEEITIRAKKGENTRVMAKRVKIVDWLETFFNVEEFCDEKKLKSEKIVEELGKNTITVTMSDHVTGKLIHVTEKRTGRSIGKGNTQAEAKEKVLAKINELGKEPFLAMVGANEL